MKNIVFPFSGQCRPLAFYLAAEEYLARNFSGDYLLLWQTDPAVIFGRNQDMEAEVNLPYCREHGIGIFRRKSGGGCVYADRGNLMISAVSGGNDKAWLFSRFISLLALFLRQQGFDAWPSGRNDIMISGRKVSGSAFYSTGFRNVMHASLLCHEDLDIMQKAITPSPEKLRSKGIASVRQRVANLSEFSDIDIGALRSELVKFFCDGEKILPEGDISMIESVMASYLDPRFIAGRIRKT